MPTTYSLITKLRVVDNSENVAHARDMRTTIIELVDDLDGTPASETVSLSLDGISYEVDLSDEHASQLREALLPYTSAARKVGRGAIGTITQIARRTPPRSSADRERLAAIRKWAVANGQPVSERGRIKSSIVEAYEEAQRQPAEAVEKAPKRRRRGKASPAEFTEPAA
jgi:nucleoid-associated protein Lsr2